MEMEGNITGKIIRTQHVFTHGVQVAQEVPGLRCPTDRSRR